MENFKDYQLELDDSPLVNRDDVFMRMIKRIKIVRKITSQSPYNYQWKHEEEHMSRNVRSAMMQGEWISLASRVYMEDSDMRGDLVCWPAQTRIDWPDATPMILHNVHDDTFRTFPKSIITPNQDHKMPMSLFYI